MIEMDFLPGRNDNMNLKMQNRSLIHLDSSLIVCFV